MSAVEHIAGERHQRRTRCFVRSRSLQLRRVIGCDYSVQKNLESRIEDAIWAAIREDRAAHSAISDIHGDVAARQEALRIAQSTIESLMRERDEAIEQRDIARAEWQGADAKAEAMQAERDEALAKCERLREGIRRAARGKCARPGCDNSVPLQPPWCSVACMDEHVKSLPPATPKKPWTCSACRYMNTTCICTKCGAHQTP